MNRNPFLFLIITIACCVFLYSCKSISVDEPDDSVNNSKRYELVDDYYTWSDAKTKCEEKGGHLATITSPEEQVIIENLITNLGTRKVYWLGMTCEGHVGEWSWITGEEFDYTNWDSKEPDNWGQSSFYGAFRNSSNTYWYIEKTKWGDYTNIGFISGDVSGCHKYPDDFGFICEYE